MRALTYIGLVCILTIGIALRFGDFTLYPPALYPDEAFYGTLAQRAWAYWDFQVYYPADHTPGLLVWLDAPIIALMGTQPWVLRVQPAIIGSLSVLAIFGLGAEFARNFVKLTLLRSLRTEAAVALFAALFLACSSWSIHLSRLGFLASYVPFFTSLVLWSLLAARRLSSNMLFALCGALTAAALYTYPSARALPGVVIGLFLLEVAPLGRFRGWLMGNQPRHTSWGAVAAWLATFMVVSSPLAIYYVDHLKEFLVRYNEVGFTAAGSPLEELLRSSYRTVQSVIFFGDGNWRHNVSGAALLHPFVAVLSILGFVASSQSLVIAPKHSPIVCRFGVTTLLFTVAVMSLPAMVTTEGIPHSLRSSGMLPPIIILAAIGATVILRLMLEEFEPRVLPTALGILLVAAMLIQSAAYEYFWLWGPNPKTRYAFFGDLTDMANFIDHLPEDLDKYIVTGELLHADQALMAQPIMFITNTATVEAQRRRHIHYLTVADLHRLTSLNGNGYFFLIQGAQSEHAWLHQQLPSAEIRELD